MDHRTHVDFTDGAEIEGALIGYLRAHPEAADTLDGIIQWWLPRQRYETARASVQNALVRLVDSGLLTREILPGGIELYALRDRSSGPRLAH